MSQSSGTPFRLQSNFTLVRDPVWAGNPGSCRVVISHSSGTPFVLQSWLVPEVMSQSSGTPFRLQSTFASSGSPLGWQSWLVAGRDIALVRNTVPVAVLARAGSNVTVIRNTVHLQSTSHSSGIPLGWQSSLVPVV